MPRKDAPIHSQPSSWTIGAWMLGPILIVAGLLAHRLLSQLPWERFGLSLLLALLAAALAWPCVRWLRWQWASALAMAWGIALVALAGPRPVLAVLALITAATALGLRFVPQRISGRLGIAAITGVTLVAGLAGWGLSLPVHRAAVWISVIVVLIVTGWRPLKAELRSSATAWQAHVSASPRGAAWTVMLLGLASTGTWLPTMQMDDLTYHLNLPAQLALHGSYAARPEHGIWAFAPWIGDIVQGIAWVLAGAEARGPVNAFWLVAAAAAMASAMRALRATAEETNAAVALMASFPPLVWLTAGMQTELPAIAALFALSAVILAEDIRGRLFVGTILVAALVALKLIHIVAALPLLAYALWRTRGALPWGRLPLAGGLLLALAGSSYTMAGIQTGNPMFPLFNAFFASPLHPPENFADTRWHAGLEGLLPWRMTFSTSRYLEAWDGGLGFTLIGLSGAWLLALRSGSTRAFAIVAACVFALPLLPMQYARYTYPGILLLIVPCLAGSQAAVGPGRWWRWSIVGLCVLNLAFQANSGWTHHTAALKRTIRAFGDSTQVHPHYVAERALIAQLPDDGRIVLATDPQRGFIAELGGRGRLMSEHDPALAAARIRADQDPSGVEWRVVIEQTEASWIFVTESIASPALALALDAPEFTHIRSVNGIALWQRTTAR